MLISTASPRTKPPASTAEAQVTAAYPFCITCPTAGWQHNPTEIIAARQVKEKFVEEYADLFIAKLLQ